MDAGHRLERPLGDRREPSSAQKRALGLSGRPCVVELGGDSDPVAYAQSRLTENFTKFHARETGRIGPYSAGA